MKRLLLFILCIPLLLAGCADAESRASDEEESTDIRVKLPTREYENMFSNPLDYRGYQVEFTGKVFMESEKNEKNTSIHVYNERKKEVRNIFVDVEELDMDVKTNNYVTVTGIIQGELEGENAKGRTIVAPHILATELEVVNYIDAVAPTVERLDVNESLEQQGFEVTIDKFEFANNQTRVYMSVTNDTDDAISVDKNELRLLAGEKQFEATSLKNTGLKLLPEEIMPGAKAEGIVIFPAIEKYKPLALQVKSNSAIHMEPFLFQIVVD